MCHRRSPGSSATIFCGSSFFSRGCFVVAKFFIVDFSLVPIFVNFVDPKIFLVGISLI